jgi:hypothetical protein
MPESASRNDAHGLVSAPLFSRSADRLNRNARTDALIAITSTKVRLTGVIIIAPQIALRVALHHSYPYDPSDNTAIHVR